MRTIALWLALVFGLAACATEPPSAISYSKLPDEGDPVRGEALFSQSIEGLAPCASCHLPDMPASPDLDGFGDVAGTRVAGVDAREYTFYAITEPGRTIVAGYGNAMPNQYDENLSPQDIADLIAYLLTR